jgi:hypothetical protein
MGDPVTKVSKCRNVTVNERSNEVERRTTVRQNTVEEHGILQVRIRPGHDVALVNVSALGALVESAHQLRPGSLIEVHLSTAERRVAVRGHVLRCSVARVRAACLWYRGAIGFEHRLPWFVDARERGYSMHTGELRPPNGWGDASQSVL